MKKLKLPAIIASASLLLFLASGEIRQMASGAEKVYTVEAGEHDFTPNILPFPHFGAREYEFSVRFDSSMWWSVEDTDYPYGNDIQDWNKVGGMTNYLSVNNRQSVLMGWRPSPEYMVMELAAYVNDKAGKFKFGPARRVPVGQYSAGTIKQFGKLAYFNYCDTIVSMPAKKALIVREVGAWFGGNQAAHKKMNFSLSRNVR